MEGTTPQANRRYVELLRQAGPAQRLEICASLTRAARERVRAEIQAAAPGQLLSEREINRRLAERLYGATVARRLFGEPPE
ncbi:MAG TPA: hypothetical protein VGP07_26690 [Polyangia bacterium]